MSDEADMTQERLDAEAEVMRKFRGEPKREVEPIGKCLNCAEPFVDDDGNELVVGGNDKRWCDEHCARDWTLRKQRERK